MVAAPEVQRELRGTIYTVSIKHGPDWLPVGEVTDSYKPHEEWRNWPEECNPCRNGFKARVYGRNTRWEGPFTDYKDAEQYLIDNSPYQL